VKKESPTVLVVDDEPAILRLVERALSTRGYDVRAVDHPWKALDIVEAGTCFDLIISDVIMPEMCGPELLKRLTPFCPNAGVIFMSAHTGEEALPQNAVFLSKPFHIIDLLSIAEKKASRRFIR
jgi:two-component system cell cycle sensor histidine kinase/response regulator CckA